MKKVKNTNLYIQSLIGVLLLGVLSLASSYYFQITSIEHNTLASIPNYEKKFDTYIESEANNITSYLELVKEKKQLQDLMKENNRKKLYEVVKPIFDHLNTNSDITHFYFIKTDGQILLRVHDENRHSDIVKRYTFVKSKEKLAPFYGLEFGIKKNYTLRVVHPWFVDGKLIGFVEIGKEVDKVIDSLSDQLGIELYFGVKKSILNNSTSYVKKRLKNIKQTDSQYIVYTTTTIPKNINWLMNGNDEFSWVTLDKQVYISHKSTLRDVSGDDLGVILYLVNITKEHNEFTATMTNLIVIMIIGTFLLLTIGFLFARQSQRKINTTLETLQLAKDKAENLLSEQKNLLSLFDKSDSVLFKWNNDEQRSIEYLSNNVDKVFKYSKDEFLSKDILYLSCIHKDDLPHVLKELEKVIRENLDFIKHDPYRIITKEGEERWVMDYTVTQKDTHGDIKYFIGYIIDVTEEKNKEQEVQEKLQKFIDTQNSIVILTDAKKLKFTNKTFLEFFGYENLQSFTKNHKCICDRFIEQDNFFHLGKVKESEANWIQSLLNLSGRQRVVSMLDADSTPYAFSVSINKYEDDDFVITMTDISDSMIEKLELTKEATVDALTGLYNRIYFSKYINKILQDHQSQNSKSGIIFFDIDHFKKVNDTYGHDVGDYVLKKVATLVKKCTRDSDKIVRWGGEEFIIICKIDEINSLTKIAENLRLEIQNYNFKHIDSLTCSFGCTMHNSDDEISDSIKIADEKLYLAKNSGRNKVVS